MAIEHIQAKKEQTIDEFIATATVGSDYKYKAHKLGNGVVSGKWHYTVHETGSDAKTAILDGLMGYVPYELRKCVNRWEVEWSKVVPKQRKSEGGAE